MAATTKWANELRHIGKNPFTMRSVKYVQDVEKETLGANLEKGEETSNIPPQNSAPEDETMIENSFWKEMFRQVYQDKKAFLGAIMVALFIIIAVFAPIFAPHDPYEVDMSKMLLPPSFMAGDSADSADQSTYLLGTDFLGRDVLSRIIYGARISLVIGLVPTLITLAIGTLLGMVSGYFGGKTDYLIMRLADICMSFPSLLLAMVVMYTLGASLFNIFIALSIVNWGGTSRIVRAQTLALKEKEFVEAAKSIGVRKWDILWRHIFPNCIPSLIVLFTLSVPEAIMSEAGLSFLGVGAQPPMPSWGLMISRGKEYLFSSPWVAITPGVAIFLVVIAFNFIGDGLRDALDPYTKHE